MLDRQVACLRVQDEFEKGAVRQLIVLYCREEMGQETVVMGERLVALLFGRGSFEARCGGTDGCGVESVRRSSATTWYCLPARAVAVNEFTQ